MKKSDIAASLQKHLIPCPGISGIHALVMPPCDFDLRLTGISHATAAARDAIMALTPVMARLPQPDLVARALNSREAVRSSQIEGTNAEIEDVFEYDATGSAEGLPADVGMTASYANALPKALRLVRAGGKSVINTQLACQLHAWILDGSVEYQERFKELPGQIRTRQNWIGGMKIQDAKIVPAPPDKLDGVLKLLEQGWQYAPAEDSQSEISIVLRAAVMHAQFELAHPFMDGNGRVGRMLIPLMFAAEGLPPLHLSGYLKEHVREYTRLLGNAQLKAEWAPWVEFVAKAIVASCQEMAGTAEDLINIRDGWNAKVEHIRRDAAAHKVLDILLGNPAVTANFLKSKLGVTFPSANTAIKQLTAPGVGVLQLYTKKLGRERVYMATDILKRLRQGGQR